MQKWMGLFAFMAFVLAIMIVWNFLIRSYVGKHPDSEVARGLAFVV